MRLELTGTKKQRDAASDAFEERLVAATDEYSKEPALYFLALLNEHRDKCGNVVRQFSQRSMQGRKRWMYCKHFPEDFLDYIALVIGRGGSNKRADGGRDWVRH